MEKKNSYNLAYAWLETCMTTVMHSRYCDTVIFTFLDVHKC